MKAKKLLSVTLSAILLGSTVSLAASAAPIATPPKTYKYVAMGDSIAAGYGLEKTGEVDPANPLSVILTDKSVILSEDLIADPVKAAYPAVFGEYLAEYGSDRGYEVSTANISAAAYSAYDIAQTIYDPAFLSGFGTTVARMTVGTTEPLTQYHAIFNKYLSDADLVSVQLGGNDIIRSVLVPMLASKNPIVKGMGYSLMMTLFGAELPLAIAAGIHTMTSAENAFTADNLTEAAQVLLEINNNKDAIVAQAANDVAGVLDAIRSVNSDAALALVGMYNPYGNSLELDGQVRDLITVMSCILERAAEEVFGTDIVVPEQTDDEYSEDTMLLRSEAAADDLAELKVLSKLLEKLQNAKSKITEKFIAPIVDACKEKLSLLMPIVIDEISYSFEYLFVGQSIDPQVRSLNDQLAAIADEKGAIYVDVYDISNEDNFDPHPTADGHKEIADILWNTLEDTVSESMIVDELKNNSTISADKIKVGSSVKVRAVAEGGTGKYQYAVFYRKVKNGGWTRVHDYNDTAVCLVKPAMAAKYEVRVDIRDSAGTVASKTMNLTVTSK